MTDGGKVWSKKPEATSMTKKTKRPAPANREPTEDEIRDCAYHLFEQGGRVSGHDLEHWLEAKACLKSRIPRHRVRTRLHHHQNPMTAEDDAMEVVMRDAEGMPALPQPPLKGNHIAGGGAVLHGATPT